MQTFMVFTSKLMVGVSAGFFHSAGVSNSERIRRITADRLHLSVISAAGFLKSVLIFTLHQIVC